MRSVNLDAFPHLCYCFFRLVRGRFDTARGGIKAAWWDIDLGKRCSFHGPVSFKRYPSSRIQIGNDCTFNSAHASNRIGVNRPCMITTLKPGAVVHIGSGCGFSGTVIVSGKKVVLGDNVRCGANTLIMDTDWHEDDPRTEPAFPVKIGNNVWLGLNTTVLKGVTIGENTFVGAGSLVNKSLPRDVLAAGMPAKIIRSL